MSLSEPSKASLDIRASKQPSGTPSWPRTGSINSIHDARARHSPPLKAARIQRSREWKMRRKAECRSSARVSFSSMSHARLRSQSCDAIAFSAGLPICQNQPHWAFCRSAGFPALSALFAIGFRRISGIQINAEESSSPGFFQQLSLVFGFPG